MDKKKLIAIGVAAIAVAVAIIVAAFALKGAQGGSEEGPATTDATQAQEQIEQTADADEGGDAVEQSEDENARELTDEQKALIDGYSDEEKQICALLAASTWTASKETATVVFTEDAFCEYKNGEQAKGEPRRYAISAVDSSSSVESGVNGERVQTDDVTLSLLLDDGQQTIAHLITQTSTSSELPGITVSSNIFEDSSSYLRVKASKGLSVEGLNSQAVELMGGKQDELKSKLTEWCAIAYPTASIASWDGKVEVNYNTNLLQTSFMLNNQANSRVTVVYDMAYGEFSVDTKAGA